MPIMHQKHSLLVGASISINLSTSQLDSSELVEWFFPIAQKDFLGRHTLIAEIPESAIMTITGARFMAISRLHDMDIGIHLDHFGCNAFPFTTLTSLPFTMIKIDRSLVKNLSKELSSDLLVSSTIMLAHHLNMKIGAVGVEEPWQAAMLKAQNCDTMQGHLTSKPMTAEQLIEWFAGKK